MMHSFRYNLISGLFAGLGASSAKVGFDFDPATSTIHQAFLPLTGLAEGDFSRDAAAYALHAAFIGLMICFNVLMLRFYALSMQENGAAKATVQNFTVNYLASLFFGWLFFSEHVTGKLVLGVVLVLAGTALISSCDEGQAAGATGDRAKAKQE